MHHELFLTTKPSEIQQSLGKNQQNPMPVPSLDKLGGLPQEGHPAINWGVAGMFGWIFSRLTWWPN